jgi:ribosome-binding protein aMBF1 (putative translation factor)
MNKMTPEQCRTARCLIGLTQDQLGQRSKTASKVIHDFEVRRAIPADKVAMIQTTLEGAGVVFLFDHGRANGVRLINSTPVNPSEDIQSLYPSPMHFQLARAWLGWSNNRLADEAGVSVSVVRDFDKGRHLPHEQNLLKIELAVQLRGIRFLFDTELKPIGITVVNGLAIAA